MMSNHGKQNKHYSTSSGKSSKLQCGTSNEQHKIDLVYVPHNIFEVNICKYTLMGVDIAPRCKVARNVLKTKTPSEVSLYFVRNI